MKNCTYLIYILFLICSISEIHANTKTLIVSGGDWSTDSNWMPFGAPGPGDTVYINSRSVNLDVSTTIESMYMDAALVQGANNLYITGNLTMNALYVSCTLDLQGSLTVNGNVSLVNSGIFTTEDLIIRGDLFWGGSTIGSTVSPSSVTVSGVTHVLLGVLNVSSTLQRKTMTCNGGLSHESGNLTLSDGAVLTIPVGKSYEVITNDHGLFGASFSGIGSGTVNIEGTFHKIGSGEFEVSFLSFNNNGSVLIDVGGLSLRDGSTSTGSFTLANGTYMDLGQHYGTYNFNGSTVIAQGNANLICYEGTTNFNPGTTASSGLNLEVAGIVTDNAGLSIHDMTVLGTFNDNIGISVHNLTLNGGSTFNTTHDLTVGGNFILNGTFNGNVNIHVNGDMSVGTTCNTTGNIIVDNNFLLGGDLPNIAGLIVGGSMTWSGGANYIGSNSTFGNITVAGLTTLKGGGLRKYTMNCNGGIYHTNFRFSMSDGATINVPSGQTFTVTETAQGILDNFSGGGTVVNNGSIIIPGNTPYVYGFSHIALINNGIFQIGSGTEFDFLSTTLTNQVSGIIKGLGFLYTAGTTIVNNGKISPGISNIGAFAFQNQYDPGVPVKILDIDMSPNGSGSANVDVLQVTGNLVLDMGSVLNLSITGCIPDGVYPIITYTGARTGVFAITNMPTGFNIQYDDVLKQVKIVNTGSDQDHDGYAYCDGDCNDNNPNIHPGATEICNNLDDNCNGQIDEVLNNCTTPLNPAQTNILAHSADLSWNPIVCATQYRIQYRIFGSPNYINGPFVNAPNTIVTLSGLAASTHYQWRVRAICFDGSSTSNTSPLDFTTLPPPMPWFQDADGDAYGNPAVSITASLQPLGYVADNTDCNDTPGPIGPTIHPTAPEICDNLDNNCNGQIDEGVSGGTCPIPSGLSTSEITYHSARVSWLRTECVASYKVQYRIVGAPAYINGPTVNFPDTTVVLDGLTESTAYQWRVRSICFNNSSSLSSQPQNFTTHSSIPTWYADTDGDGYGDPASTTMASTQPPGYVSGNTDCNDTNANIHPGAYEYCNAIDDDCDGQVDEVAIDCATPSGQNVTNITATKAKLIWASSPCATTYNIQTRVRGTSAWTNRNTTNAFIQLSNLTPGTQYEWRLRAKCGLYFSGFTSPILRFTTLAALASASKIPNQESDKISQKSALANQGDRFKVYPNPASGQVQLTASGLHKGTSQIKVLDQLGATASVQTVQVINGQFTLTIDLFSFTKGLYFIQLTNETDAWVEKVMVE